MSKKISYPDYISKERVPVAPPQKIINDDGTAVMGTFNAEIPNLNLLDLNAKPHKKNLKKYTEWEALELHFDDFAIVSAVYSTGPIGFAILVYFDKNTGKVSHNWLKIKPRSKVRVAPNLIDGVTELHSKKVNYWLANDFKNGKAYCKADFLGKKGQIEIDVELTNLSDPSVVSIPLGENLPLYSQKNIFSVQGHVTLDGKKFEANQRSVAIIDDHKGYYPHLAHYDWLTTMTRTEVDGEMKTFGFNLTRNQSLDQDKYNENILWLDNDSSPLPPVFFTHDENDKNIWYVKDEHGKVDIKFVIEDTYPIVLNVGIIMMKYYLPFGKIYGEIEDINGKKYNVDGMLGIGEDKTTKM